MSPSSRMGTQQSLVQSMSGFNSLGSSNISDIQRIRDEFSSSRLKMSWDESSLPGRSVSISYFLFMKLHKYFFKYLIYRFPLFYAVSANVIFNYCNKLFLYAPSINAGKISFSVQSTKWIINFSCQMVSNC